MHIFYTPRVQGRVVTLSEKESRHSVKVLRLREGSEVTLVDGSGTLYQGQVIEASPKQCAIRITETYTAYGKRDYRLHMGVAPTKNTERFEWFLEKAVEMGVDEITPLNGFHSERKRIKPERFERIMVSAMKQSVKAYKPQLNPLTDVEDFIAQAPQTWHKYIAHCREGQRYNLAKSLRPASDVLIAIGPEGDFAGHEVEQALERGFTPISLGSARLRTETAGVAAVHTVYLINQK